MSALGEAVPPLQIPKANARHGADALWLPVGLIAIALLLLAHALFYDGITDDAFILFRYVDHFLAGHGLVYNVGDRVEGYTSFLWAIVLAALSFPFPDPIIASKLAGIASGLLCLFLVWKFSCFLFGRNAWALVAPVLLALDRTYAGWCTGGLETKLFTALIFAATSRAFCEHSADGKRLPLAGLLFGLATLARPEAPMYLATFVVWRVAVTRSLNIRDNLWLGLTFLAVVAPHLLWRHDYYGEWLPNTYYVKVNGFYADWGLAYVWLFFREQHLIPVIPALVVAALTGRRDATVSRAASFFASLLFMHFAYVIYIGGDTYEFRFVDAAIPWMSIAAAGGAYRYRVSDGSGTIWRSLATALVLLACLNQVLPTLRSLLQTEYREEFATTWPIYAYVEPLEWNKLWQSHVQISNWINKYKHPGDSLAVHAAGHIPYFTGLPTLDLYGLNDKFVARLPILERGIPGHEKRAPTLYVKMMQPTFIIEEGPPYLDCRRAEVICVVMDNGAPFSFTTESDPRALQKRLLDDGATVVRGFIFK